MSENEGLRILKLAAENFMRLKAVEITPDGNTVMITGKNEQGKSSVLDAITAALCGKQACPDKPVRNGQDNAEIVIELNNMIVKRTFTEKGSKLVVTNKKGMTAKSPQDMLDKLVGEIAFDPMQFIREGKTTAGKRQQRDTIMKLAGLDFSDIDQRLEEIKAERSEVNSKKKHYEHERDRIPQTDLPDVLPDIDSLNEMLSNATEHNQTQQNIKSEISKKGYEIEMLGSDCERIDGRIEELKEEIDRLNDIRNTKATEQNKHIAEKEQLVGQLEPLVDIEQINSQLQDANKAQQLAKDQDRRKEYADLAEGLAKKYTDLGKQAKDVEAEKIHRLANADMPLDGLSVDDDGVLFKGVPLAQVNTAKKLEISVAISMALNPKLRVIRMSGNDLDSESLKTISKLAADNDYQVWIEKVEESGKVGFVIEDGMIVDTPCMT